jgi:uncharacterized Zn finger protein (UPF0148 family)
MSTSTLSPRSAAGSDPASAASEQTIAPSTLSPVAAGSLPATRREVTLADLDAMPAPGRAVLLSDMSIEALSDAFVGLEKAQGQFESLSGTCATLAGLVLLEAKERVGHGNFQPWLKKQFPKDYRSAQRYMQLGKAFRKYDTSVAFEQLALPLLGEGDSQLSHTLDFNNPLVGAVAKWTRGRSFYQLRQEELTQGGNQHPKCPHCEGDLASKDQEFCPHCGKATGQQEKTPDELKAEILETTRQWAHGQLNDTSVQGKRYRLLPDHELQALIGHFRGLAGEIEEWVKTPAKRREEMAIEEVLA